MPRWLRILVVIGAVLATLFVGLASWDNLTAQPSVADPAVRRDVRIVRDRWGVPHIFGKTDADVAYGLAIAHAEDDFRNLEEVVAAVRGRGGAITGQDGASVDFAGGLLGANAIAAAHYADLSPDTRRLLAAYAQGLNEYAAGHPGEARLRGLFPVNGQDIVAGFMLRAPFFFGLDRPLAALVAGEPVPRDSGPPDERGSNGFAVAGRRSADGVTRLIVNSHQPWEGGVSWWEVVVHSGEGWDFAGALFPGAPYPLLGHNKTLGWTNTVNRPDLIDTYWLTVNAAGTQYRFDGKWLPLDSETLWLRVKLGPLTLPIPRKVYRSVHGPVVRNDKGYFAIRYAGIGDVRQVEQYYRLNKARNLDEWREAMAMQAVAGTNFVYADAAGHIGMFYNARFPRRASGYDWKGVLPGDTSKTLWTDYHPWADDPMTVDPAAGWVANSNNTPFLSTAPADEQARGDFPPEMGIETYVTNRARRYQALFAALGDAKISRDDLLRIKFDKGYDKAGWAGDWYRAVMALDTSQAPDLAAAQKLIATWDWTLDCKGNADTLVTAAFAQAARYAYQNKPRPDTAAALREAVDLLERHYGRIDVPLGDFQRLRHGKVDLPVCGGPEALRAIIGTTGADGRRVANNGDGFIMLIEWAPDGQVSSRSVHQFGAATVRPQSPHYADQSPLFVAERWKTVPFDASAVQIAGDAPPG
ncbi:penicillin acylase family protein [Polymorphobacter fuscus]|uniref:Acylase n=1 Tax=Sandarakinorhabdus fusca TaxID=1439888 RepID=A0A7C9GMP5_9SPHN|nr:penicillin acylase family protein [Polymorphobacter fuscus]KAB7648210.1 acylase [Polymorphobacter fuscus]MQT15713.1 acylase [Polymorphobacter fuscus]NJC08016.1 acyl-homoserine-lactone acylase [Polymorphobacter fuscus]